MPRPPRSGLIVALAVLAYAGACAPPRPVAVPSPQAPPTTITRVSPPPQVPAAPAVRPPSAEPAPRTVLSAEPPSAPSLQQPPPVSLARLEDLRRTPFLTRAHLAALVGAVSGLPAADRGAPIMTDVLDHPERAAIMAAVAGGYLDAYPNHLFRPEAFVSRSDLADCLWRVANRMQAASGDATAAEIPDVPPSNRFHRAVSAVVGRGLMDLVEDGGFHPAQPVSGAEGWESFRRLVAGARS